ncbi:MAG: VWA domain-containing protein [Gammaproteobacteria bacterium]|nr:VWA domain-containing protein [Gammaproteobacteria bacterium]
MPRNRRPLPTFSLSFLDIMSCGLGAMVLLFLIIKHNVNATVPAADTPPDQRAEVNLLDREVRDGQKGLAELRNTIDGLEQQRVIAEGMARRIQDQIREAQGDTDAKRASSATDELAALEAQIRDLEQKKQQLELEQAKTGEHTRAFSGEGTRQYLTGLQIGGDRILVLLDTSASMLDETLVNVIRRRNMTDERRTGSRKWRQAVATLDWLTTRFPVGGKFQVYLFDTDVKAAVPGTEGQWLDVANAGQLETAVQAARDAAPDGGTSLERAFQAVARLRPLPDNVYLITDGLPTQGISTPRRGGKVTGNERLKLFNAAANQLPNNVPVNTILLPMEGDPMAAFSFWGLAVASGGSFLSPAADWP